jgi:outer membrane protein assembly factor BamB
VRFLVVAAVLLTLLAAAPATLANVVRPRRAVDVAQWTSYGHDAQLTNRVRSESLGAQTASRLALQWRAKLDGRVTASPLAATLRVAGISRTLLFVATWAGSVSALDARTGSVVWSRSFGLVDTGICGEYGLRRPRRSTSSAACSTRSAPTVSCAASTSPRARMRQASRFP